MASIKTFIFFDLETSGLPQCTPSKITEIAFVAAGRDDILKQHNGVAKENNFGSGFLPRVLNKLNFTVYPCKMIHPSASAISGLTNENLEHQKPFDANMVNILQLFMDRLEKPLCLVAHNGSKFDFPILQSELIKIGKEFPEDVFCVDSLPAFRDLLSAHLKSEDEENLLRDVLSDIRPLDAPINRAVNLVPKCGFSQEEYDQEMIKTIEVTERVVQEHENYNTKEIELKVKEEMEKMRRSNETTPVRKSKQALAHPTNDNVRRKILNEARKPKPKYNLSAVYERVTKKELVNAHRAENDALALLECMTAIGLPILEWMDTNKIPFRNVKRMW